MSYGNLGNTNNPKTSPADQSKKIFLGGLSYNTTDETLSTFCSRFGKLTDCVVMRTPEGKSRGFGFVTFEDSSSVEDFMRARPHTIDNRQIDSKRAMPREDQNSSESHLTVKKLFVAGLRDGIDEACLHQYFSSFGNITEVLVMNDRDGKPRGFAFVSFDDYDAVDKVILSKPHIINGKTLDVKKAVPKDKMQDTQGSGGTNNGPSYQRNYSNSGQRNNYEQTSEADRDWNDQNNYRPQSSQYGPPRFNTNQSGFNPSAPSANVGGFQQPYNSMGQNQLPPPPPPPMSDPSVMNYNPYNNSNMPYNNNNNNMNQSSNTNFIPPVPPPSSFGSNQQSGFGMNSTGFNNMNNQYNMLAQQITGGGNNTGYTNSGSSMTNPYDNSNSYDMNPQNYGNNSGNYNEMSHQQTRGGASMRGKRGRGGGPTGNIGGNNSYYGNRSAPYPSRGRGGGSSNFSGRGRGRGQ